MSDEKDTISFRTGLKEDYKQLCEHLGVGQSTPAQNFVELFLMDKEFRGKVLEEKSDFENGRGLRELPYNQLPSDTQEYLADVAGGSFAELVEGDYQEAMVLGEHVYRTHEPSGEFLAQVTANFLDEVETDYHI